MDARRSGCRVLTDVRVRAPSWAPDTAGPLIRNPFFSSRASDSIDPVLEIYIRKLQLAAILLQSPLEVLIESALILPDGI